MKYLVITVRFLSDRYHGRTENGNKAEWPPSPLRLYQAILAGAARRWHDPSLRDREFPALEWFQSLGPPQIIAPKVETGRPLLKYVRENLYDVDPEKRDAKLCRPTLFCGEARVTYYWSIESNGEQHANVVANCAYHCCALGWGIDMVIGRGVVVDSEPQCTTGEKWLSLRNANNGSLLRVPRQQTASGESGTLCELIGRFKDSLERLSNDARNPVRPLRAFLTIGYRRATDALPRSIAAFSLLKEDASGFLSFGTERRAVEVVGMMRHVAKHAAKKSGWTEEKINAVILGHAESASGQHLPVQSGRFAYFPLPTLEFRGEGKARVVGRVRRVMLSSFAQGLEDEIAWAGKHLSGLQLIGEHLKEPVALLSLLSANENIVRQYTRSATTWATVTPVVLPGYDDPDHYRRRLKDGISVDDQKRYLDRLDRRIEGLLRKAISQAGFSEVLAEHAQLEWRPTGFWPGVDLASRYRVPDHLTRFPRLHVKISWRDDENRRLEVPGPVCIGGGRFYGLGLCAAYG